MVPCEAFREAGRYLPWLPSYGWQAIPHMAKHVKNDPEEKSSGIAMVRIL